MTKMGLNAEHNVSVSMTQPDILLRHIYLYGKNNIRLSTTERNVNEKCCRAWQMRTEMLAVDCRRGNPAFPLSVYTLLFFSRNGKYQE